MLDFKNYYENFKYICIHKYYVFKECWKAGLYLQAFTHDMSKFLPKEFNAYTWKFFAPKQPSQAFIEAINMTHLFKSHQEVDEDFKKAWKIHYSKNKHHWQYWDGKPIPMKYLKEMVCDWNAMSITKGGTTRGYYLSIYDKINLDLSTRLELELYLHLIDEVCLVSNVTWKNYCEKIGITMEEDLRRLESNG